MVKKWGNSKCYKILKSRIKYGKVVLIFGWEWDWSNGIGSYTEGTYYGEVTTFLIIGFIKSY